MLKKKLKGFLSTLLVLALLLSCVGAQAEFSPRWTQIESEPLQATLGVTFTQLDGVTDSTLAVLNNWLSRTQFFFSTQKDENQNVEQMQVTTDGTPIFSAAIQELPQYTLTVFDLSGNAYLTLPEQPNALSLMLNDSFALPQPLLFTECFYSFAETLYPYLAETIKASKTKESTSIRNCTASASYETYTVKKAQMPELLGGIVERLNAALAPMFADAPDMLDEITELLNNVEFTADSKFKRFLDKAGNDMGMQLTGSAKFGTDERKITLYGGYTPDKGGYVSISLPATKGTNNLKANFGGSLKQTATKNTLELESTYTRTMNKVTHSAEMTATLYNALQEDAETWTGKVTLTVNLDDGKKTYTITPNLTLTDAGLTGTIDIQEKTGSKATLACQITLNIMTVDWVSMPTITQAMDLRTLTTELASAVMSTEWNTATGTLILMLAQLPQDTLNHLTFDFRNDQWMNGPVIQVVTEAPAAQTKDDIVWIVEED